MRKRLHLLLALALTWLAWVPSSPAAAQEIAAPNEVLLKLKGNLPWPVQTRIVRVDMGLRVVRSVYRSVFVVRVPSGQSTASLIASLSANANVEYAEPNAIFRASSTQTLPEPNDPFFFYQWNLKAGTGINCLPAWQLSGGTGVSVALLDTGYAYETAGAFRAAPDLDPARVYPLSDWVNTDTQPLDDEGHGTFMAGLIASNVHNSIGTAGIAPFCSIMPSKVLDASGMGTADTIANGIYEAALYRADIILLSANSRIHSQTVQMAIDHAVSQGIIVVCPSGNDGLNLDTDPNAPAVYGNTIVVGATKSNGTLAGYSNYGRAVRLVAPGAEAPDSILAQPLNFNSAYYDTPAGLDEEQTPVGRRGTCVAAAHVVGVLALTLALDRTLDHVIETARDLGPPGRDVMYGEGIVDAGAATGYGEGGGEGGGGGGSTGSPYDVAVTQMQIQSGGSSVSVGQTVNVVVTAANAGDGDDLFTVRLYDETLGEVIEERAVSLAAGAQTALTFAWQVRGGAGTRRIRAEAVPTAEHSPERSTSNNRVTASVEVVTAPFVLKVQTYEASIEDNSRGEQMDTFLPGVGIYVAMDVTEGNQPVSGATVQCVVRGASGRVLANTTLTTDAQGHAFLTLWRVVSSGGGYGQYTIEATATRNPRTSSATKNFVVQRAGG